MDEVEKTLIISYETRMNFAHYVFENEDIEAMREMMRHSTKRRALFDKK